MPLFEIVSVRVYKIFNKLWNIFAFIWVKSVDMLRGILLA